MLMAEPASLSGVFVCIFKIAKRGLVLNTQRESLGVFGQGIPPAII